MASSPLKQAARRKQPAGTETSKSIEEQTEAFLQKGGEIQVINSGVSGQQSVSGPKHITLGKNPRSN